MSKNFCRCEADGALPCHFCLSGWHQNACREMLQNIEVYRQLAALCYAKGEREAAYRHLQRADGWGSKWRDLNGYPFDADDGFGFANTRRGVA